MAAAVEFSGVCKRFEEVAANDSVSFAVGQGSIHGVIGENGAGKSTLMKILYGLLRPDSGRIWLSGKACDFRSPAEAIRAGVGMVHQHFLLAGAASVLDNVILGSEPGRWGWLDRKKGLSKLERLAEQYGLRADWHAPVETLPVGVQQRVELLKLLYQDAKVLILDEPTAVLTPNESEQLFHNLLKLKAEGKTVLLVTHKLKEVLAYTDTVTVLRSGKVSANFQTAKTNQEELAFAMVGRRLEALASGAHEDNTAEAILEIRNLTDDTLSRPKQSRLNNVNLVVRRGEILGIAGVEGNGQSELLRALVDSESRRTGISGSIRIDGKPVGPSTALRSFGVAFVPEDRQAQGLLLERSLSENFLLGWQAEGEMVHRGLVNWPNVRRETAKALRSFDVRPTNPSALAAELSGGNQQKFLLGRELHHSPVLLIAAQPTRGVDIGAMDFIHRRMLAARDAGAGVLLISSDLDEILALSTRIVVMFEGRIVAEYSRNQVTERELGLKMGGG